MIFMKDVLFAMSADHVAKSSGVGLLNMDKRSNTQRYILVRACVININTLGMLLNQSD